MPNDTQDQQVELIRTPSRRLAIRNLTPRLPERGKIKIGIKGAVTRSERGKEFQPPQKIDHFRVTTLERGKDGNFVIDEEFHRRFGPEPKEIPIRLLYDDVNLNFPTRYACFLGRTLWCSGDGESAVRLSENPPQNAKELEDLCPRPHEVACTCFRQDPVYTGRDKCKMNGNLSVIIDGQSGLGGVWNFRTTGFNTITGIMSSLSFIWQVTGGVLANIPLRLRLQPKQATSPVDGRQVLIYVVGVEFAGNIDELQTLGHQIALARATTHVSIKHIEDEARRRLLAAPLDIALPGDTNNDVIDEFYPEQIPERPTPEQFQDVSEQEEQQEDNPITEQTSHLEHMNAETGFHFVDTEGVVHSYRDADLAASDFLQVLYSASRRGLAAIDGVWESNEEFRKELEGTNELTMLLTNHDLYRSQHLAPKEPIRGLAPAESRPPVSDPQDHDADRPPYKLHTDEGTALPRRRGRPTRQLHGTPPPPTATGLGSPPAWVTETPSSGTPSAEPHPASPEPDRRQQDSPVPPTSKPAGGVTPEAREEVMTDNTGSTNVESTRLADHNAQPAVNSAGGAASPHYLPFVATEDGTRRWYVAARKRLDEMHRAEASVDDFREFRIVNTKALQYVKNELGEWGDPVFVALKRGENPGEAQ